MRVYTCIIFVVFKTEELLFVNLFFVLNCPCVLFVVDIIYRYYLAPRPSDSWWVLFSVLGLCVRLFAVMFATTATLWKNKQTVARLIELSQSCVGGGGVAWKI